MSLKLPAGDDWAELLAITRDASPLAADEPVPHGQLMETVREVSDVETSLATEWIETAVTRNWLRQRGTDTARVYVAPNEEATLYDRASFEAFLDEGNDTGEEGNGDRDGETAEDTAANAETPDSTVAEIHRALDVTVDYYHSQLDDDLRWMIEGKWGIASETIDDLRIGFAPSNNDLPAYLDAHDIAPQAALRAGVVRCPAVTHVFDGDPDAPHAPELPTALTELTAARAAGEVDPHAISLTAVLDAVRESATADLQLYAWWDARIVFPYSDADGTLRYLIARKTGQSDDLPGKYLKLGTTKPWVDTEVVFEPIYGCETVESGEDLLLTEGITDAIRAHEAGIRCISPVTKAFKQEHYDQLLAYAAHATTVYLCFDSETSGVGLDGALRTARFLRDNDVDARVAELPRGDREEKVDLAEFLKAHPIDAFHALLDDAIPPDEHAAFDAVEHGDAREPRATGSDDRSAQPGRQTGRSQSALFDLSIADVVEQDSRHGVSPGYRGDNPIQHVGDSHSDYFVYEDYHGTMRARDYKAEYTYTALTWLACAAGARSTRSPGGSLSDEELWAAWHYAKQQDILGELDPIPWRARLHIARTHDLAPRDLIDRAVSTPSNLPTALHNRILDIVEDEYGVNPALDPRETTYKEEQRAKLLARDDDEDLEEWETDDKGRSIKRMLAAFDEIAEME